MFSWDGQSHKVKAGDRSLPTVWVRAERNGFEALVPVTKKAFVHVAAPSLSADRVAAALWNGEPGDVLAVAVLIDGDKLDAPAAIPVCERPCCCAGSTSFRSCDGRRSTNGSRPGTATSRACAQLGSGAALFIYSLPT